MKITKKEEKENPLLHRKEIKLNIKDYKETPSRRDIVDKITAKLNIDEEKLVIDKVDQEYGKKEANCTVKIYDSEEAKEKYSPAYKDERTGEEEEEE